MILTTLDILYITLSIFTGVIGTLLAIVLFKVIKILGPIQEMAMYYETVKGYLAMYAQIPAMVKEYVFELLSKKDKTDKKSENEIS